MADRDWSSLGWTPSLSFALPTESQLGRGLQPDSGSGVENKFAPSAQNVALLNSLGYTGQGLTTLPGSDYGFGAQPVWSDDARNWMASKGYTVGVAHDPGTSAGGRAEYFGLMGPDGKFVQGQSEPVKNISDTFADQVVPFALMAGPILGAAGVLGGGAGASAGMAGIGADGVSLGSSGLGATAGAGATAGTGAAVGGGLADAAAPTLATSESGLTAIAPETIGTVTPGVSASELSTLSSELPGQVVSKTLGDYALQGATRGAISGGLNSAAHGGDFGDILKGAALGGTIGAATGTIGGGAGQFNVGDSLGSSGATSNIINGVSKGIISGAMNSAATGKDFDPTNVLAGGAGAYAGNLGLAQTAGLDGDWAKGVNSAIGSGVSSALSGKDVGTGILNSAGGSALDSAAGSLGFDNSSPYSKYVGAGVAGLVGSGGNLASLAAPVAGAATDWFTTPTDQHFLADTPAVPVLENQAPSLRLPASPDLSNIGLPAEDTHMTDDPEDQTITQPTQSINYPSFSSPDTGNFGNYQPTQSAIPGVGGDSTDTGGDLTFQGDPGYGAPIDQFNQFLNGSMGSLTANDVLGQVKNLGVGDSIMKAINGLGSFANDNKTLAALLAGGISSYANAARQDKLYQRNLDELHSQQANYRSSVSGLRTPSPGIIGTHALMRTDGTPVFKAGTSKLNVGG